MLTDNICYVNKSEDNVRTGTCVREDNFMDNVRVYIREDKLMDHVRTNVRTYVLVIGCLVMLGKSILYISTVFD